jgi:UDPglucose--hexose-1-phosphate uridylyltransferase
MTSNAPDALWLEAPHRRLNALTGEWVFVSPQRTLRPWQGRIEPNARVAHQPYDPTCYLCPGNLRASGTRNPPYAATHVFDNDFPAFLPEPVCAHESRGELLRAETHAGICRVVCYSPRHDLTLADMPVTDVRAVIETWAAQVTELTSRWRWVQVFENKGEIMGCSNPHPHGQIWAGDFIPNECGKELAQQRMWRAAHSTPLLLDYAQLEVAAGERVVVENAHWVAVVPWWAVWPFETLVLPRRHVAGLPDLSSSERDSLAELLGRLLRAYDRVFDSSFPYSFGWHGSTSRDADAVSNRGCQLHAHFYPPLLRSASVRKFMVGYEMLAEAQRDMTAEQAAMRLRECDKAAVQ